MKTTEPSCCYHKIFGSKRKGVRLTYDFKLTVGFLSDTRWYSESKPDQFIEFSLRRAELHLDLENGDVDFQEGDKLGGKFQLDSKKKIINSKKFQKNNIKSKFGATVSSSPSAKIDVGGNESSEENNMGTEVEANHFTVQGNLAIPTNPFWTFYPIEKHLRGNLVSMPLCGARSLVKSKFSYSSRMNIQYDDIDITQLPNSWKHKLPFSGLRIQKIKIRIVEVISLTNNTPVETDTALTV